MAYLLACVRWRSSTTGQHYCEYYDKRTGEFLSLGMGYNAKLAEQRAITKLDTTVRRKFPSLERSVSAS